MFRYMIDIAKSAVCSFLTCNDRYDWSVYTVNSEHWVIKRCHIVIDGVGYTCIRIMG